MEVSVDLAQIGFYLTAACGFLLVHFSGTKNNIGVKISALAGFMFGELLLLPWKHPDHWFHTVWVVFVNYFVLCHRGCLKDVSKAIHEWRSKRHNHHQDSVPTQPRQGDKNTKPTAPRFNTQGQKAVSKRAVRHNKATTLQGMSRHILTHSLFHDLFDDAPK